MLNYGGMNNKNNLNQYNKFKKFKINKNKYKKNMIKN